MRRGWHHRFSASRLCLTSPALRNEMCFSFVDRFIISYPSLNSQSAVCQCWTDSQPSRGTTPRSSVQWAANWFSVHPEHQDGHFCAKEVGAESISHAEWSSKHTEPPSSALVSFWLRSSALSWEFWCSFFQHSSEQCEWKAGGKRTPSLSVSLAICLFVKPPSTSGVEQAFVWWEKKKRIRSDTLLEKALGNKSASRRSVGIPVIHLPWKYGNIYIPCL